MLYCKSLWQSDSQLPPKALAEEGGYTYYNEKNNVYSMIDHCFMSRKLYGKCEQVAIVDKVGNFSDHLPVNVKLNVKVCHYFSSENVRLYAKWDNESNKMYYNNTRDGLYMLDDGCNCSNVICYDSSHNTCIDDYCEKIIRILHDSTVWGCVTRGKEKGKFAWSRLLDEAKRHAKRQHKIWMQSGKNRVGIEFDNVNVARREYKKELKKAKNLEKHRRCEYVESVLQKKDNMFWKNWRKINSNVRTRVNDSELANGLLCNFNSKY